MPGRSAGDVTQTSHELEAQELPSRRRLSGRENFIGDKISINPIIPFIAEVR
jgi:hypothetical protein